MGSGYKSFVRNVISKYFLSICGLSFQFLKCVFFRAKAFNFDKAQFISCSLYVLWFGVAIKNDLTEGYHALLLGFLFFF